MSFLVNILRRRQAAPLAGLLVLASLCVPVFAPSAEAQTKRKKVPATDLIRTEAEPVEELLLDVGIQLFDPGLPHDDEHGLEEEGVFADVRKAEARFLPVRLMNTLQSTGFWGAVRVVPRKAGQVDLLVKGRIVESSGAVLEVEVRAEDARGRVWLKPRRYRAEAEPRAYRDDVPEEPFQHLYNFVANRLLKALHKMDDGELREIRRVTEMRFAEDLAPTVFDGYLTRDRKGRLSVQRLPADGDPMSERVAAIRERDYLFIDTLTEHYAAFEAQMIEPYDSWRRFSYEEEIAFKQVKRQARNRKILGVIAIAAGVLATGEDARGLRDLAIYGGIEAFRSGMGKTQEAKLHRESLRELALSFDAEVQPELVEVEGRTLKLSGSVETQFDEWRKLLRRLFAEETGESLAPDEAPAAIGTEAGPGFGNGP